ncbi:MAG: hypothetical protein EAZ58_12200 [Flavobacterium sp.]|nr:MAG: hypothetical protein EAZ58_12200 [Flavobacterium sp.]
MLNKESYFGFDFFEEIYFLIHKKVVRKGSLFDLKKYYFSWIDSKPNKREEQSLYQFFTKQNPKSWRTFRVFCINF